MKSWPYLCLVVCAGWLVGCSSPLKEPAVASNPLGTQQGVRAGVAEIDITPPPGLSLAGHGPEGRVARGHRGRLRCRALFAADQPGESLAWVVCDLWAPSALLHRRVARLVASKPGLGADRLILSATHTHGGPAHYSGARSYSGPFTSERPGFDERVLDWLARSIAKLVLTARQDALAGGDAKLTWHFGKLQHGLTRNRSLEAYCKNQDSTGQSICGKEPDPLQAVDRELPVLLVERRNRLLGVFAVAAMHPTAIPNTNEVYHADTFGLATRKLFDDGGGKVVYAIANGLEGDVSPNVVSQSWTEAERIGSALAESVKSVVTKPEQTATGTTIKRAYREVDLGSTAAGGVTLCQDGAVGDAASGGTEDGKTRFSAIDQSREGAKLCPPEGCHGPKRSLTAPLTKSQWSFPTFAPMHVAELGGALLVTLPFEMTTAAGLKLRGELQKLAGSKRVVLVGLTNDYLQYVTTEAEYQAQHYEGASVIYGPKTAAFFTAQAATLLRDFAAAKPPQDLNQAPEREFSPSPRVKRFTKKLATPKRTAVRQPFAVEGRADTWAVEWSVPDDEAEPQIAGTSPLIRIQVKDGKGWKDLPLANDLGTSIWMKRRRALPSYYYAVWQAPAGLKGTFRFVIGFGPRPLVSGEFSP